MAIACHTYFMDYSELSMTDPRYPDILRHISDPPKQLFWAGQALDSFMSRPRLAIVGSRKVSAYGRQVTLQLSRDLAGYGIVIVSGLALGVDAIAHRGALEAGGQTIAVLPTSLDALYPVNNAGLGRRIVANGGTLASEYPRGSPFQFKYNFVARNRIISGLSDAVLITEAAADSGSLHTAEFALQQGREVLVVPGNITSPTSQGTNQLLKMGATPVTEALDVLRIFGLEPTTAKLKKQGGNPAEQTLLNLLSAGVHEGETLLIDSGLPIADFNQALTMLEINGQVQSGGADTWY